MSSTISYNGSTITTLDDGHTATLSTATKYVPHNLVIIDTTDVSDALDAIADKGVTVPSDAGRDDLAALIAQIPTYSGNAVGTNTISGGAVSCSKTSSNNVTMGTSDTYANGITMTFTGSRAAATATAAITTAGYAAINASFATDSLAADSATSTYYIQGVTLTIPSSGTRQFDITVPNGNSTVTFHFSVDANGNTSIT